MIPWISNNCALYYIAGCVVGGLVGVAALFSFLWWIGIIVPSLFYGTLLLSVASLFNYMIIKTFS